MNFQEREIKLYLENLPALAERLRVCGAEQVRPRTLERNFRLDTPDRDLAAQGQLLRLRQDDKVRVTFKEGGRIEDGIIARQEIEFTTDNFEITRKLFEALGYEVVVIYEKYRQIFEIGDVEVVLDELPFGDFIEIDGPSNTLIEGVAQMLGLDMSCGIGTNYLGLFEIARANARLDFNDLTFENFKYLKLSPDVLQVRPADV
jgi:adenylate cyclase class 2